MKGPLITWLYHMDIEDRPSFYAELEGKLRYINADATCGMCALQHADDVDEDGKILSCPHSRSCGCRDDFGHEYASDLPRRDDDPACTKIAPKGE